MNSQRNTGKIAETLPEEQVICIRCGLCCDGTLFLHAHLDPGERGNLPEKIERNSYSKQGSDYFRLPCGYFDKKCTIYNQKKANVCSGYYCQLLRDLAAGRLTFNEALAIVEDAVNMRTEIIELYRIISGKRRKTYFKKLLRVLGRMQERSTEDKPAGMDYDMLLARCNIFEVLLIRHFSQSGEFEKMIMK